MHLLSMELLQQVNSLPSLSQPRASFDSTYQLSTHHMFSLCYEFTFYDTIIAQVMHFMEVQHYFDSS